MKRITKVALVGLALLVVMFVCVISIDLIVPDPDIVPDPEVPEVILEPTIKPSEVVIVEPTLVPEPTATSKPKPTATEVAQVSIVSRQEALAILEWLSGIQDYLGKVGDYSHQLSDQFSIMADDPMAMFRDVWIHDTAVIIVGMNLAGQSLTELQVPTVAHEDLNSMLMSAHLNLLEADRLLNLGLDSIVIGLDNMDLVALEKGIEYISDSTDFIDLANVDIDKMISLMDSQ